MDIVQLDASMQKLKHLLLLPQGQKFTCEYLTFSGGYCLELFTLGIIVLYSIDSPKVHVLVHVSLLHQLYSIALAKKHFRLKVQIVKLPLMSTDTLRREFFASGFLLLRTFEEFEYTLLLYRVNTYFCLMR